MDKEYASDINGENIIRKPTQPEIEIAKRKGSAHEIASHLHTAHNKVPYTNNNNITNNFKKYKITLSLSIYKIFNLPTLI